MLAMFQEHRTPYSRSLGYFPVHVAKALNANVVKLDVLDYVHHRERHMLKVCDYNCTYFAHQGGFFSRCSLLFWTSKLHANQALSDPSLAKL